MNQLTNKVNNYHHKTSSDYISKNSLKKNINPTTGLFKPNTMSLKINKISNSKNGLIYFMNQKAVNGRSFDKKLQEKKDAIKNYIKNERKQKNKNSEKNSFESESRDEISTNNLTEILYNYWNMNNTEYKNNDVDLNIKANGKNFCLNSNDNLSASVFNTSLYDHQKIIYNLNSKNIMTNKKEQIENKSKNMQEMKHIKVNTKNINSLNINCTNCFKKCLDLNLNTNNENKKINLTKRKYSHLTEDNRINIGIGGLIPLKSKTQNYINLNIKNYYSNKKLPGNSKIFIDKLNNSYGNNKAKNNMLSSNDNNNNIQKKNKVNLDNIKQKKKPAGINHINIKQQSDLILNIFSTKKLLKVTSPRNKNNNMPRNINKDEIINNKHIKNEDDNIHTITQETEKKKDFCYTDRIKRNNDHKGHEGIKNINYKKLNLFIKKNFFFKKKMVRNYNINKTDIKSCKLKEKKINLNKDDIIISKKKKKSQNSINNSDKKPLKLEKSFQEKNNQKYFNYNMPLINKVHVFEIGNNKISKNFNLNTSNNIINENKKNNYLQSLILNSDKKSKENNNKKNIPEFTPTKKKLTDIINNNMKNKKLHDNYDTKGVNQKEDNTTPKLDFTKDIQNTKGNINDFSNNINNTNSNIENKYIKMKNSRNKFYKENKEFCEMETPILLNTTKFTERMIDTKLNLFEKIKNMKTNGNSGENKKDVFDTSSENNEIIYEEIPISYDNNYNKNSIKYIISLDKNCIEKILDFLDINIINILCLVNKKCFNIFKPLINRKLKSKILAYYTTSNLIYANKIKLSLMTYSPLGKLTPILLHKKFMDLLLENNQKYDKEIQKDLTRTFPDKSSFKYGNKNYNKLYHLLTVYSLYNEKIGYAQGINFIAANVILLMEKEKEETCLMFLDGFLQKFNFGKLLGLGVDDLLKKNLNDLGKYLDTYCPEISKFFESWNLSHEIFSTNWILTLFANSMESKDLFIIWDFLIIFGWKFFMCFIVKVLNLFKKEIISEKQNNLNYFMKNILRNQKFKEKFNYIIDMTIELMNKKYKYNNK